MEVEHSIMELYLINESKWGVRAVLEKLGLNLSNQGQGYTESNPKASFRKSVFREGLIKTKDDLRVELYMF